MQNGEWWLDDSGQTTFADGDIGDANHEMIAFQAALEIDLEDSDLPEMMMGEPLSQEAVEFLEENGVSERAINFFKKGGDARDYALEFMGWIRIKGKHAEVWKLDDGALENLKGADIWDEEDASSDEELFVEERSTHKSWSIPFKVLSKATSAEGLKRYMDGVGKYHTIDGFKRKYGPLSKKRGR